jgi:hypothetical protein
MFCKKTLSSGGAKNFVCSKNISAETPSVTTAKNAIA